MNNAPYEISRQWNSGDNEHGTIFLYIEDISAEGSLSKETSDSEKENTFHEHLFVGVVGGLSEFASLVEDEGEDCAREYTERRVSSLAGEGGARAAGEKDLRREKSGRRRRRRA